MAGPAQDARHAETTLQNRSFGLSERSLPAIGPSKHFCTIIRCEHHTRILFFSTVLQFVQHDANVVIQLSHTRFFFGPAVLSGPQRFILRGEVRHDVHARRIKPDKERLVVALGLVDEFDSQVTNLVIHSLHALGIQRTGVLYPLFAYWAPAGHLRLIVLVRGPTMHHVTRTNSIQQILRIVWMGWVLHRI